jgi:3-methyl-2-oxobutanoate hydroxymethyltransferase
VADALELERAGAFAVVLESIPADLGSRVSAALRVPTVGIGAGPGCDARAIPTLRTAIHSETPGAAT